MSANEAERLIELAWRRASFCASTECVEVAQRDDVIILRDSTKPHGSVIRCNASDWRTFVNDIKNGKAVGLGS